MDRRNFMQTSTGALAAITTLGITGILPTTVANSLEHSSNSIKGLSADEAALDNDFWAWVRQSYTVSPNVLNLNNGGVSPQPLITQEAFDKYNRFANEAPSYYMWRIIDKGREALRDKMAILAGCSSEEIAFNRNTTEGLNTIIFGLDLERGDEVILNKFDYPNMMNAWRQREKRDGIVLKWIDMDFPMDDEDQIVNLYLDQFTSKTKVVHITHVINWVGQVVPTRRIADAAHARGIEVIVDGAHSFAQMEYSIPDLGADYYATSLHKWLCAPFGTGLMWIKKEKIKNIWALLSAAEPDGDDIRKFENLGTRHMGAEMAIGYSLDFHNIIGTDRKRARLLYLRNYWMQKAMQIPGVGFYNSFDPKFSCALANFYIEGKSATDIDQALWKNYKIHTVSIKHEQINGVRVTPNIYTNTADLDRLVTAIEEIAKS